MQQFKQNLLANFMGRGWYALISLVLVPFYIRFLGMEAYGLVGFFVSLQTLLSIFDFGLGATFNREMARYSAQGGEPQIVLNLARTLELVYWGIGILVGFAIFVLSNFIGEKWVNAEQLSPTIVSYAIILMGLVLALQWPTTFYEGGLRGLGHPTLLNSIKAASATVRGIGTILTLWLVSSSIHTFFWWQVLVSLLQTVVTGTCLWSRMPRTGQRARLKFGLLRSVWSFAAGLTTLSVSTLLLGQFDKVILSKILTLKSFGYYSLSCAVAYAISIPMAPIAESLYPRMSQLIVQDNGAEIGRVYHQAAQLLALAVFPVGGLLIFFSKEILFLWTGDLDLANESKSIVSILSLGVVIQYGVMGILDVVQMSYGWVKPAVYSRLFALILLGPMIILLTAKFGMIGAAISWLFVYGGFFLLTPYFVFKNLLIGEKWNWYLNDLILPLIFGMGIMMLCRNLLDLPENRISLLLFLTFVLGTGLLSVALSMQYGRTLIIGTILRFAKGFLPSR